MMARKTWLLVALGIGGILLAACGRSSTIAVVDGTPIPESSALALRHSYEGAAAVPGENLRQDVTRLVLIAAEQSAAEKEFGLTGLDDPNAIAAKLANPAQDEARLLDSIRSQDDFTDATLRMAAHHLVIRERVAKHLILDDPAYLEDAFTNHKELISQVCVRHILVNTKEEADAVVTRLNDGEDFATVAGDVSLDTSSPGGKLPCPVTAAEFIEPFGSTAATAPIGEITGPIQTQFGWHVLIVDQRTGPASLDELRADPLTYLQPKAVADLWQSWLQEAVGRADVEVRSDVGTWISPTEGIAAPPTG